MHASYPERKVIGGTVFTAVYLWKNNMTAAIAAYLSSNATILLGYRSLGIATVTRIIIPRIIILMVLCFHFSDSCVILLFSSESQILQKNSRQARLDIYSCCPKRRVDVNELSS
jgi:hypothetical protein